MVAKPDDTPTARLKISVRFDGMTWAELRAFVNLCKGVSDTEPVSFTVDPHSFDFEGLEEIVWLPVGGATDGA